MCCGASPSREALTLVLWCRTVINPLLEFIRKGTPVPADRIEAARLILFERDLLKNPNLCYSHLMIINKAKERHESAEWPTPTNLRVVSQVPPLGVDRKNLAWSLLAALFAIESRALWLRRHSA